MQGTDVKLGMALAEVVQEAQEPCNEFLTTETLPKLEARHEELRCWTSDELVKQGVEFSAIKHEVYLNLRYRGSDTTLMILKPADGDWRREFIAEHLREFAFVLPESREIIVDDVRVRGIGVSSQNSKDNEALATELGGEFQEVNESKLATETVSTYVVRGNLSRG